jgi:hypothetical protein
MPGEANAAFDSCIGKGTKISGKLNFNHPARIEGEAEGRGQRADCRDTANNRRHGYRRSRCPRAHRITTHRATSLHAGYAEPGAE